MTTLIDSLRSLIGQPPAGWEFLEYIFLMIFVVGGVCMLYALIMRMVDFFRK